MFIKDLALHSEPLVCVVRKRVQFAWGPEQAEAFDNLKTMVSDCPAIKPLNYQSDNEVTLAVDSSHIAVGYVLSQMGDDGLRYPSRYGSISHHRKSRSHTWVVCRMYSNYEAEIGNECGIYGEDLDTFAYVRWNIAFPSIYAASLRGKSIARRICNWYAAERGLSIIPLFGSPKISNESTRRTYDWVHQALDPCSPTFRQIADGDPVILVLML
jgi:hypothetical protein